MPQDRNCGLYGGSADHMLFPPLQLLRCFRMKFFRMEKGE